MSDDPSKPGAPKTRRVESTLGEITDSSSLFTLDKGATYRDFWNEVSRDWAGAAFAVVGTPFDEDPTPESTRLSGEPEVAVVVDKLHIGSESRVLEIGAGIGRLAWHMADACGTYVGCDISEAMLDIARPELEGKGNVELVTLDQSDRLPFPDASFDAVYAQAVMIHLDREDCYLYMQEALRVLRPGGRAWFQFFNLLHPEGFRIFDWGASHMVAPDGKVRGRVQCLTADEVRAYVQGAGFSIDEAGSHLEREQQHYPFTVPTLNFEYYLVAVGEKPTGEGPPARLLPEAERRRAGEWSAAYYERYVEGFCRKIGRHALAGELAPLAGFLRDLPAREAFEAILEIERGVLGAGHGGHDFGRFLPELRAAIEDDSQTRPLPLRIRDRFQALLALLRRHP